MAAARGRRTIALCLIAALGAPTPSAWALRPSLEGKAQTGLEEALRPTPAGLEEMDPLYVRKAVQGLYQFPDLVEEHFGKDGAQPASWAAFLDAAGRESSWTWDSLGSLWKLPQKTRQRLAYRSLRKLPVPLRLSVGGELVLHNQREGVLLLGENGAEPSLLAIFMTGDYLRGWSRHYPYEWIFSERKYKHTWTYLGGDLLVLEFPQGLYAGRLPRKNGQHKPLTTRFPLEGATEAPVHEGPFEGLVFQTEIEGKDQFVPLKGVVRFSRHELLDVRTASLPLGLKLPESLRKLPAEDLLVDISQLRWRTDWDKDPEREKELKNLQRAARTVEDFFVSQFSAGVEEVGEGPVEELYISRDTSWERMMEAFTKHPPTQYRLFATPFFEGSPEKPETLTSRFHLKDLPNLSETLETDLRDSVGVKQPRQARYFVRITRQPLWPDQVDAEIIPVEPTAGLADGGPVYVLYKNLDASFEEVLASSRQHLVRSYALYQDEDESEPVMLHSGHPDNTPPSGDATDLIESDLISSLGESARYMRYYILITKRPGLVGEIWAEIVPVEAAGLEETARVEGESIIVPVADQLVVGILAHSPGIRELQASLRDSGVQVKEVRNPRESAELLRAELVGLLILAPEDSEAGDWRGGTLVPTVVMPARVAAGLTEREMAALAAEARARGGILHINDITREGAEEQVLVLRMA